MGRSGCRNADEGELTVPFPLVEAIADDEKVRYRETGEIDAGTDFPAGGLVEQAADFQRGGSETAEFGRYAGDGQAGIDDIFDHEYMAARNVDVVLQRHAARGAPATAIARGPDEFESAGPADVPDEVGREDNASLEHAEHHDFRDFGILGRDGRAQLGDAVADAIGGDELSDAIIFHGIRFLERSIAMPISKRQCH